MVTRRVQGCVLALVLGASAVAIAGSVKNSSKPVNIAPEDSCYQPKRGALLLVPKQGEVHLRADSRSARFWRPKPGVEVEYVPSNIEYLKEIWHQVKLPHPVRELTRGFMKRETVVPVLFKMQVELGGTSSGTLYASIPLRRELALDLYVPAQKKLVHLPEEVSFIDPLITCSRIVVTDLKKPVTFGESHLSFFRVDIIPKATQEAEAQAFLAYWDGSKLVKGPALAWPCATADASACLASAPRFVFPDDPEGQPGKILSPSSLKAFNWKEGRFKTAEYKPGDELLKRMPANVKFVFDDKASALLLKSDDGKVNQKVDAGNCTRALVTADGRKALVFTTKKECPSSFDTVVFFNDGKKAWTRSLKGARSYDASSAQLMPGATASSGAKVHWNLLSDQGEGALLPILEDGEASTFATKLEIVDQSGKTVLSRAGFFDGLIVSPNGKQAFFKNNEVAEVIELASGKTVFKSEKEGVKVSLSDDGNLKVVDSDEEDRQLWPRVKTSKKGKAKEMAEPAEKTQ